MTDSLDLCLKSQRLDRYWVDDSVIADLVVVILEIYFGVWGVTKMTHRYDLSEDGYGTRKRRAFYHDINIMADANKSNDDPIDV